MEDIEIWKEISNYDNYKISSFGNFKNNNTGRILKPSIISGYYCVGLSNVTIKIMIFFISTNLGVCFENVLINTKLISS